MNDLEKLSGQPEYLRKVLAELQQYKPADLMRCTKQNRLARSIRCEKSSSAALWS